MKIVTIKTKGTDNAGSGYASIEGTFNLDREFIKKIEAEAIAKISADPRLNIDAIHPTITDITIVKPYAESTYNVRCKINIGTGWYIDVDLYGHSLNFEVSFE